MNPLKHFFNISRSPFVKFFVKRQNTKILKRLAPEIKRLLTDKEEAQAHCLMVRFAYDVMWIDLLNPLFAMLANIIRNYTVKKEMVLVTDKRLMLFKLTLRNRYAREAYEILNNSIKRASLWAPSLAQSQKVYLKLQDNSSYVLETTKHYPLHRVYDVITQQIGSICESAQQSDSSYHSPCARCGAVFNRSERSCPACGFKQRSLVCASVMSFLLPGLGQLYVGQIVLGTIFMAYHILILCFVYVYAVQWIGRWNEVTYVFLIQMGVHMLNSSVKAFMTVREMNQLGES